MTQTQKILNHLKSGQSLNVKEAQELYGCYRLSARIHDLTSKGHSIASSRLIVPTKQDKGARVAVYSYRQLNKDNGS